MLPADLSLLHALAALLVFVSWVLYSPLVSAFGRGTLNNQLGSVRARWIATTIGRQNRAADAVLLGHIINSVAFFGSATLIVLAGLVGTLANVTEVHRLVSALHFAGRGSLELFSLNLTVVSLVMLLCFFSFTYALRKLIYTVSLLGGLPEDTHRDERCDIMVTATATVLSDAINSFNSGIRGFYLAVAALFLFVGPIACIVANALVMGLLLYRQLRTPTAMAIERYVDALSRGADQDSR